MGDIEASLFPGPNSWTLRSRVDEVTVFFTATEGHKFSRVWMENIRVKDDNKPVARISAFGYQRDLPFRLGLVVVDTSSSVNPQFRFQQKAAIQFLRQVVRQGPGSGICARLRRRCGHNSGLQR